MAESKDQVSGEAIRVVSVNANQKSEKAADTKGQSPQIEVASQDSQIVAESLDANDIEQMSNQLSLDNENKKDGDHDQLNLTGDVKNLTQLQHDVKKISDI